MQEDPIKSRGSFLEIHAGITWVPRIKKNRGFGFLYLASKKSKLPAKFINKMSDGEILEIPEIQRSQSANPQYENIWNHIL